MLATAMGDASGSRSDRRLRSSKFSPGQDEQSSEPSPRVSSATGDLSSSQKAEMLEIVANSPSSASAGPSGPRMGVSDSADGKGDKKISCLTCREAKVKCITDEGEQKCRRCVKLDAECRVEEHRRGRKKGKIKQHQVNRRFELIARTLEELRGLTRSLQDAPAIALIASLRYQLLSSTCVNDETRSILLSSSAAQVEGGDSKAKKRAREEGEGDDNAVINDDHDDSIAHTDIYSPLSVGTPTASSALSFIHPSSHGRPLAAEPQLPPEAFSQTTGLEQHQGLTPAQVTGRSEYTQPPAFYPGQSSMMFRASALAGRSRASQSASLLVEIEDYEAVAIVPQAVQTLSNPLKLLAHASDAVDSARRPLQRSPARISPPGNTASDTHHQKSGPHDAEDSTTHGSPPLGQSGIGRVSQRRAGSQNNSNPSQCATQPNPQNQSERHAHATMEDDELVPRHRKLNQSVDQREAAAWDHFVGRGDEGSQYVQSNKARYGKGNQHISPPKHLSEAAGKEGDGADASIIKWSSYFSRGAFHPKYDSGPALDPIERRLLTVDQAQTLLAYFYDQFDSFVHCFDPNLSTLPYLRKHSAFAVSVICCIAAEHHPEPEYHRVAARLADYIDEELPAIMSGVYKSVEISQACLLLAYYQRMADSAVDDQTWALLGTAVRIASELGCNLACFSYSAPAGDPAVEKHHRQLRNTERLWLNLWIFEKTIASQTGQKLHLADDPVISSCGNWHRGPYAMNQDEALVAFVDLRRIMDRHATTFHTQILRALTSRVVEGAGPHSQKRSSGHSEQVMLLVDLYRANVSIDFKRWEENWLTGAPQGVDLATPLQTTGVLHLHFATLVILSLPLRSTSDMPTKDLNLLRRDCYGSAVAFLSAFLDRSERGLLPCLPNAMAVSAVYCAIFALKLCGLSPEVAPFINPGRLLKLAKDLALQLRAAGSVPSHRAKTSVPARFAEYLFGYLSRWQNQREPTSFGGTAKGDSSFSPPLDAGSGPLTTEDDESERARRLNDGHLSSEDGRQHDALRAAQTQSTTLSGPDQNSSYLTMANAAEFDEFWQSMMTSGGAVESMAGFDALLDQMSGFAMPTAVESYQGVGLNPDDLGVVSATNPSAPEEVHSVPNDTVGARPRE